MEVEDSSKLTRRINFLVRSLPQELREDARQEAWVGILKARGRFDSGKGASSTTYAGIRACGAVRDFARREDPLTRRQRREVREGLWTVTIVPTEACIGTLRDDTPNPEEAAVKKSASRAVVEALLKLKPRQRALLQLLFWEQVPMKVAAQSVGLSLAGAHQCRNRAIAKLKGLLGPARHHSGRDAPWASRRNPGA